MDDWDNPFEDPRAAHRRARAIADEVNWGGDLRTDARAKASHDAAVACIVEALATAHLADDDFVIDRVRKRFAAKAHVRR